MKHLIIFVVIIIGVIFLTLISRYDDLYNAMTNNYNNIYLENSKIGGKLGRGVFANKNFNNEDIIERAPYIEDKTSNFSGLIRDYIFTKSEINSIVAFGFGSLYNHSDNPNAMWRINGDYLEIIATKPINKDEEILISYGKTYWNSRKDSIKKLD
jgi:hypothetical protein